MKKIIHRRSAARKRRLDQRLDKPGTVFVAVGTAHLAGADSLQKFLAGRGIKSKRAS